MYRKDTVNTSKLYDLEFNQKKKCQQKNKKKTLSRLKLIESGTLAPSLTSIGLFVIVKQAEFRLNDCTLSLPNFLIFRSISQPSARRVLQIRDGKKQQKRRN